MDRMQVYILSNFKFKMANEDIYFWNMQAVITPKCGMHLPFCLKCLAMLCLLHLLVELNFSVPGIFLSDSVD